MAKFMEQRAGLEDLCKRRFFYRQGSEIYGGVAGFYTYGPPGCAMKANLLELWRRHFVMEENLFEIEDTCIMSEQPLKASGHVDRFTDLMVKDVKDESKFYRADKLLEDVMDDKINDKKNPPTEEQKLEYTKIRNLADGYSIPEIKEIFAKYNIKSPETGNDLSDPYDFNLMFGVPIGPTGNCQGYLRPETAQGIFLNYKFCLEQNGGRMPFGVSQIGKAFRNEIAPRAGLTRQREFTQAEIEYFVNPRNKDHPKFTDVQDLELQLFPANLQMEGKEPVLMKLGDAVKNGIINNETLGYFIGRVALFLETAGCQKQHVRFRQHLPTEMAHYACDCWDAETETCYKWLEVIGIADRSCYDLSAHSRAANIDLKVSERLAEPKEVESCKITKKCGIALMKEFKKDGKKVKLYVEDLEAERVKCHYAEAQKDGQTTFKIDGTDFVVTKDLLEVETKMVKVHNETYVPGVIEPSFGIDRILFSILEHSYSLRPAEKAKEEAGTNGYPVTNGDSSHKAKETPPRAVLKFTPHISPYKVVILPLDQRVGRDAAYKKIMKEIRSQFGKYAVSFTVDDSGVSVGKRYARSDEVGIFLGLTIDFDSLTDANNSVTLRDRDTCTQVRLPLEDIGRVASQLCSEQISWAQVQGSYDAQVNTAAEKLASA